MHSLHTYLLYSTIIIYLSTLLLRVYVGTSKYVCLYIYVEYYSILFLPPCHGPQRGGGGGKEKKSREIDRGNPQFPPRKAGEKSVARGKGRKEGEQHQHIISALYQHIIGALIRQIVVT